MRTAPHLVHSIPFVLPLRKGVVERAYVAAGLVIYDVLARIGGSGQHLPVHRQLSKSHAMKLVPALNSRALTGAIQYWDAQVDDARHTLAVLRTAASYGAIATSGVVATALLRDGDRVVGAEVTVTDTGETHEVHAAAVISATGVWTEQFEVATGVSRGLRIAPSKGVHLVVPREAIDSSTALIIRTPKSVLFVLPWGEHWILGTTDTKWSLDVSYPVATSNDISYILSIVNTVLARPLGPSDIESVYVGLRPLIAAPEVGTTEIPREHSIARPAPGLVVISGGKYTTYRVMAKDAVDAMLAHVGLSAAPCRTATIPLVGADHFEDVSESKERLADTYGLDVAVIRRLLGRYGSTTIELLESVKPDAALLRPLSGAPRYLRAEVDYAVTHEGARHLEDVLARRTRLSIESRDRGQSAAEEAANIMARRLGWSPVRIAEEIAAYLRLVAIQVAGERETSEEDSESLLRASFPSTPYP
jgi:glycerol-3-phosphate dehydrogenase